jgi:hypothetical protein
MRLADGAVIHQVHAAKIGADVGSAVVSNFLLWRERPAAAMAVRVIIPVAASGVVLALADLDGLSRTRRGRYVLAHMPLSAQAVRLAGDALMGMGAYRRSGRMMVAGAALIGAGWSHALWPGPGTPAGPALATGPARGSRAARSG